MLWSPNLHYQGPTHQREGTCVQLGSLLMDSGKIFVLLVNSKSEA